MNKKFEKPAQVNVRYEQTSALYASQFVLNATGDEIIINFSSGSLPDPTTGEVLLPIHSRIAISPQGARTLIDLLNQALQASNTKMQAGQQVMTAKLPSLE